MDTSNIMGLFPEPIGRYKVWADSWQTRLDQVDMELHDDLHWYSKSEHVLDEIPELRRAIGKCLKQFTYEILNMDETPIITQSWINRYEKGQHIHEHHHPNSLVSATWYWRIPEGTDAEIRFHKQGMNAHSTWTMKFDKNPDRAWSPFAVTTNSIRVEQGDLLIWPSYMIHSVPHWPYEQARCSLSLDSIPRTWGSGLYRYSVPDRPEV